MKSGNIQVVQQYLSYVVDDLEGALAGAREIKDPELTNKLTEIQNKARGIKDYIVSKTDPKTLG